MDEIINNSKAVAGTFMHALHENSLLDQTAFIRLTSKVAAFIAEVEAEEWEDQSVEKAHLALLRVTSHLNTCLIAHFDPNDGYSISNLPSGFHTYPNRMEYLLGKLIQRSTADMQHYEDDLGQLIH